jgi:hypothetical protein
MEPFVTTLKARQNGHFTVSNSAIKGSHGLVTMGETA